MHDRSHRSARQPQSDDSARLWISMTEQAARITGLEARLNAITSSRSWRLTGPLRALLAWFAARRGEQPRHRELQPERRAGNSPDAVVPPWLLSLPFRDAAGEQPCWLLDVTELALEDLGAGVQRVTRRLLTELLLAPPSGCNIEPVRLTPQGQYCRARTFLSAFLGLPAGALGDDDLVTPRSGDTFVGLDFCRARSRQLAQGLATLRKGGVQTNLIVHDTLPLTHPQWFPDTVGADFESWLAVLSSSADRAICISHQTAVALRDALARRGLAEPRQGMAVMTLGADLVQMPDAEVLPTAPPGTVRVLTVGTIEPRKGHAQALDAFETLWAEDEGFEWVIVGRPGWQTNELVDRLRNHPELGRRLHWLEDADDRTLGAAYRRSDALLMASRGEGFGLPLVEAGALGLGLITRDLPVFREVAGTAAAYFRGDSGRDIADALRAWRQTEEMRERSISRSWTTWAQSAQVLKSIISPAGSVTDGNPADRSPV